MRRGVCFILAISCLSLIFTATCTQKRTNPLSENPSDTLDVALSDYVYVDTTRPFVVHTLASSYTCEPVLAAEKIIGEPFSDINHNGVYDPGVDWFVISNDPATNQDLNLNGRHDGPENMTCSQWSPGIPFDDIDGDGEIRCSSDSFICPAPSDSAARRMPFFDVNHNGVWDSVVNSGASLGKWRSQGDGPNLTLNCDSAYRFVSDSGLKYYLRANGADVNVELVQSEDEFAVKLLDLQFPMPRVGSFRLGSQGDTAYFLSRDGLTTSKIVRDAWKVEAVSYVDSVYHDILLVELLLYPDTTQSTEYFVQLSFGKQRGLLKAGVSGNSVGVFCWLDANNRPLPLAMTRPAR